jgi:uncharacterized membrane protein
VCGGPRIEGNLGGEAAIEALKEQKQHLGAARLASIATVLQGMFATAVALVMFATRPETTVARAIFFVLAVVPLALSFVSRWRASKARGRAKEANERALEAAAEEVARGGVTAKEVAKKLRIAPSHAERLLTAGMATDRVRIDVHDESAEVVYRSDEESADGHDEAARADERRR